MAVGDGAELFLTANLGVKADDNIFMATNKVDDIVFNVTPGVDLVFGKGSVNQGHLSLGVDVSRYSQTSGADAELLALNFSSNYDDGKTKFSANAGFNELNQNTVDVRSGNNLNRRDVSTVGLNAETSVTGKSKVSAGLKYSDTAYKRTGNVDLTTVAIPLNYYYGVTEKVDLSAGFQYRNVDLKTGIDAKEYFYRVGARGEFSPMVTGSVMVGYGTREPKVGSSKTLFDMDAMLNVALSPKSSLQLTASNDFGVSAAGQEQKNFSLGGIISSKVSDQLSLRAGLSYRGINYYSITQPRTDDYVEAQLGVDYVVSTKVSLSGAYAYRNNKSDLAGSEFNNNVLSLSANFRY